MSGFSKKILIVTGDQSIVNRIVERISLMGHETYTAYNEDMALGAVNQLRPHMIILDLNIDGVDSFHFFETLRQNPDKALAETPVIIATQGGDLLEISRAIKLGVKDYFVKGTFDPTKVAEKVQKHIEATSGAMESAPPEIAPPVAAPVQVAVAPVVAAPAVPPGQTKVLIVEDDKFLRDLATQKLAKENLLVVSAVDGEQGIMLAEKEIPNIILLDILLPGIDGFEVLRRVRANPALANTKVAMLSNFGQREDIEKALNAGANQFLVKANYTLDEIVEEVKKIAGTN